MERTENSTRRPRPVLFYGSICVVLIILLSTLGFGLWWFFFYAAEHHKHIDYHSNQTFKIDYDHDVFLKDGKPFYFVSGEFHYFRTPSQRWRDIFRKMRAAGLNCVSTYVEWSSHEPHQGRYEFSGDNDIENFVKLASEEDLLVILRPGPYICAERDFGGFPPWLLTVHPGIKVRTSDQNYLDEVKKWFDELFWRMEKHLYGNGGSIIMVQVENEYGSLPACDGVYTSWLRDEVKYHVDDAAVLFTTDGAGESYLKCGFIPDVYATVDFGPGSDLNHTFGEMRKYTPHGPLMNSEFYAGWLTHWGEPMNRGSDVATLVKSTKELLDMKANINYYMFFGGTNFHLKNGANYHDQDGVRIYQPDITSYDYGAPLDEAGDPTPKYFAIRDLLSKHGYSDIPDNIQPKVAPKGNYGKVQLKPVLSLFNSRPIKDKITRTSQRPSTFEEMGLQYGFAFYEKADIPENVLSGTESTVLALKGLRDKCTIYADQKLVGKLTRNEILVATISLAPGQKLSILVENQGRINFQDMNDPKGLIETPKLNSRALTGWNITGFPFEDMSWISQLSPAEGRIPAPAFYVGEMVLPPETTPLDTYIDPSGWEHGLIFVNHCGLGRYWVSSRPQLTLFVPAECLRSNPMKNKIIVFETVQEPDSLEIVFTDKLNLDKTR